MTDCSDTEADFHPTDPADLAILNMDLANADTRIAERLANAVGETRCRRSPTTGCLSIQMFCG